MADSSSWGSNYRLVAAERWKTKSAAMGRAVTDAFVEYAAPQPGMKVLDLASGTGEPAISLAQRVAPDGHVTAFDLSADLLEIAAERARQRNLANFTSRQGDAHDLPFADNSFDLATCRFGAMFFADIDRALTSLRRVLKPNARACFALWGPANQPYWATTMAIAAKYAGGPMLAPGGPDLFRFAAPGSFSDQFRRAGYRNIAEDTRTLPWTWHGTAEEVWEYCQAVSAPFRPMLERVPAEQRPALNAEVLAAINQYFDGSSIHCTAQVVFASAAKPATETEAAADR